jgi:hypothetical protein
MNNVDLTCSLNFFFWSTKVKNLLNCLLIILTFFVLCSFVRDLVMQYFVRKNSSEMNHFLYFLVIMFTWGSKSKKELFIKQHPIHSNN